MESLTRDLVFLILQFLEKEKFKESVHKLEQESGLFFNMEYFGEKILAGEWDEVEKYLSGFTKVDDNRYSTKIFFEIRKQKYLEALDRQDRAKAVEILVKDLKVFSTSDKELFKDTTMLLTLEDFREHELLSGYGDTKSSRSNLLRALKLLIVANPLFRDKLAFPTLKTSRLRALINQSLTWQHGQCKNPEPNPDIKTLFTDHMCPNRAHSPKRAIRPVAPVARPAPFAPLACGPFPPNAAPNANANVAGWMANPSASYYVQPFSPNQVSIPKRPRTLPNAQGMVDYQNTDHEQLMKRLQSPAQPVHEVTYPEQLRLQPSLLDNLPRTVAYNFKQRSNVTSMGFHPSHQTLLLGLDPVQCQVVTLPESADPASKVSRLLYTNSGAGIMALGSNGIQKLWKWGRSVQNPTGMATASVIPQHWQPNSGLLMINDISDVNLEEAVPCIALSKNDAYVMSAAGGRVSLFSMMTFKVLTKFMPPPPVSSFLEFHPKDNNIVAIGMEDSTTHIYNVRVDEVKTKLKGHQKRITGLAFSTNLNILVSSGADVQLCTWNTDTWEKKKWVTLQHPSGEVSNGDTHVQFHSDQIHLLVCHETQLAIYDASKMECIRQWVAQDGLPAPISFAAYSCNSLLVYAAFRDGNIGVFDAETLTLRCHIDPSAYITQAVPTSSQSPPAHPLVLATHPQEPNQLAVGLTDGFVKVIELDGKWGMSAASAAPADDGIPDGLTTAAAASSSSAATSK